MKKIISFLFFISVGCTLFAQTGRAVYFEIGGPGLASINYDTRFAPRNDGIGGRVGVGGFSIDGESVVFVPLQINYLLGQDNKHYFEFGGGATIVSSSVDEGGLFENSFGHLHFGYRVQPADGGFLFRAAIVPIFGQGNFVPYYAGISFGYRFQNAKK